MGEAYKFWVALADLSGFRIDTVKHLDEGASRYFASVIHEFAQTIGNEQFYLVGEITGGRERAFHTLDTTGNATAAVRSTPWGGKAVEVTVPGHSFAVWGPKL